MRLILNVIEKHVSQILKLSMNWVLVPKLPSEYKVDFNVIVNN